MHQKFIFPNLNTIRFIAAFFVIIHHTEQFKDLFQIDNAFNIPFIYEVGKLGVILFFTLSGFLITYLLLRERENKKEINIKNFYMRRVLRIWPLYYFIVILSFFVIPLFSFLDWPSHNVSFSNFPLKSLVSYIFILPNFALSNFGVIPYASQAWSIGTEEQFYLIWPLIFIFLIKRELRTMLMIIVLYIVIHYFLSFHNHTIYGINVLAFWETFNIDCMAIGGSIAYIEYKKLKISSFLKNKLVFFITVLSTIILVSQGINFGFFNLEIYAVLFAIIILNLACNPIFSKTLEIKPFKFLGEISYGLYMYHPLCIVFSIKLLSMIGFLNNFSLYLSILFLTISISYLSYTFFEKPFLKLKNRY